MKFLCRWARISGSWQPNVKLSVDSEGWITAVEPQSANSGSGSEALVRRDDCVELHGAVLPALVNVHSHAFQWGFAGASEFRTSERDTFWTWREQMFAFLEQLDPERMYQVARDLYARMRQAGYAWVGEFHYVHTAPDLSPYRPRGLLGEVLVSAARDAGLGICLLPTLYQRGGFDERPLAGGQRRFGLSESEFQEVVETALSRWGDHSGVRVGIALHSLRAVAAPSGRRVVEWFRRQVPHGVIHIHVAEQEQEVADCLAATGRRPVEFLLDEFPVDRQWCLIHATHLTADESRRIADSGAVVGLCPTTEANLGDGIFSAEEFLLRQPGRIGIGGDSHVAINPWAELRQLETSQRLRTRRRAILCTSEDSCGEFLYDAVARGGAQALGVPGGELVAGTRADWVVLSSPDAPEIPPGQLLDRAIFCDPAPLQQRVYLGGQLVEPPGA
ncbi:MAG: formimidoylglutamate deiminase [Planctomycetota bacterium]